jgi:hypothetical protein
MRYVIRARIVVGHCWTMVGVKGAGILHMTKQVREVGMGGGGAGGSGGVVRGHGGDVREGGGDSVRLTGRESMRRNEDGESLSSDGTWARKKDMNDRAWKEVVGSEGHLFLEPVGV